MSKWEEIIGDSFIGSVWQSGCTEIDYIQGAVYTTADGEKKQSLTGIPWEEAERFVKQLAQDCGTTFGETSYLLMEKTDGIRLSATKNPMVPEDVRFSISRDEVKKVAPSWVDAVEVQKTLLRLKDEHKLIGKKGQLFLVTKIAVDVQTETLKYVVSRVIQEGNRLGIGTIPYAVTKEEVAQFFSPVKQDYDAYKKDFIYLGEIK
ncbi:hypothetical protein CN495_08315 [Bacillus thuringiensis]|uniref:Uncharacterized protein n=1 Tax=Bacillus thuringiensis TaxID=1428 RepID=A0ABD6S7D3_BACTU|nr:hypothetical protein [Bacillus thuringiensis]PER55748.1 hypothetical protein CN495_08315 [Bacillus thuringiensis]